MKKRPVLVWALGAVAVLAVLGLGYLLSLLLIPTPQIAVIRIEGDLWAPYTTYVSQALEEVGRDRAVRAAVLDLSSPGGEVTASEGLYFDVLHLREVMPVVVSVDEMAASGAYYVASAGDDIYSKPASMIGNIGVISILPDPDLVHEKLVTTGPFKLSGGPAVEYVRQMEMMKDTFLAAIEAQRSSRLQVGSDVLSRGEIYIGLQAQQMGLIDQIGSLSDAISAAARMAKLRHYTVVEHQPAVPEEPATADEEAQTAATSATLTAAPDLLPPGFYYRYVQPAQ